MVVHLEFYLAVRKGTMKAAKMVAATVPRKAVQWVRWTAVWLVEKLETRMADYLVG